MAMTGHIDPVDGTALAEGTAKGDLDPGTVDLLRAERSYIASRRIAHRLDASHRGFSALCLSGGGIRSAAFALGVSRMSTSTIVRPLRPFGTNFPFCVSVYFVKCRGWHSAGFPPQ